MGLSLSTPMAGTEMSWREVLKTGQVEWKGKMVGVEMNTLDVTEEIGNGEKKKRVKWGNKDLLN